MDAFLGVVICALWFSMGFMVARQRYRTRVEVHHAVDPLGAERTQPTPAVVDVTAEQHP